MSEPAPRRADLRRRAPRPAVVPAGQRRTDPRRAAQRRGPGDLLRPGSLGAVAAGRRPPDRRRRPPDRPPFPLPRPDAAPVRRRARRGPVRRTGGDRRRDRLDPRPWFRCPFGAGHDDPRVLARLEAARLPQRPLGRRARGLGGAPNRRGDRRRLPRRRQATTGTARSCCCTRGREARATRSGRSSPGCATSTPTSWRSTSWSVSREPPPGDPGGRRGRLEDRRRPRPARRHGARRREDRPPVSSARAAARRT